MDYKNTITADFRILFNADPIVIRSPARINLIGEHTDYNQGFVLPAAIDRNIFIAMQKRLDNEVHVYSDSLKEYYSTTIDQLMRSDKLWPDYLLGVIDEFKKRGKHLCGLNAVIKSDIPFGSGLSSSAALGCAFAYGINELYHLLFNRSQLVDLAKDAENNFVGVKCGIMDQFASMFGKKDQLIKLDTQSLEFEYVPFSDNGLCLVLFDSGIKHSLASSAYNQRREECKIGVEIVSTHEPGINSLRDVTEEMLIKYVYPVDETIYNRCTYVVAENNRVLKACDDLRRRDFSSFGLRMYETHNGLKDLYEVSCDELDLLVNLVEGHEGVLGARMMGGGFGGCTINLIEQVSASAIIDVVSKDYFTRVGLYPKIHSVAINNGTELIST